MKLRAAASALLAGAVLAILAGCGLVTPIATNIPYAPSDGVQGTIGKVKVLNALAITDRGNPNANLLFTASNGSAEEVTLNAQYEVDGERSTIQFVLEPNSITNIGFGESGPFTLTDVGIAPGELFRVYFQYGPDQGVELGIPVLDGTLEQYRDLLPPGSSPSPVPADVPGDDSSESPAPDAQH